MVSALQKFWHWVSEFGIPEGISPDERKVHVSANQLMMVTLILISMMSVSLLVAWLLLLKIDFAFYRYYFFGGLPAVASLILGSAIYIYRGKTGRFYGPIVAFAYLMTALIASLTIIFGGVYGLEYWVLVVMGIGIFVLHRRKVLRRLGTLSAFVIFLGLRIWVYYIPPILPVPHEGTRIFYILFTAAALLVIMVLEFRFISQQSARAEEAFIAQRDLADKLLLNIMPQSVAHELKAKGRYEPRHYDSVTVLFTDFVGFTRLAATMKPTELLSSLDDCFREFDRIVQKHGLEKLKTIGDSYMCAAGIPDPVDDHA
ncbi:MAG TPA: adenylate/guanylate cyclase domain-containing protein, partial [Turneriella sp.]|nr:adenylate/guanylate cyclase domain-containing protein [Turneriella sp.]